MPGTFDVTPCDETTSAERVVAGRRFEFEPNDQTTKASAALAASPRAGQRGVFLRAATGNAQTHFDAGFRTSFRTR